MTTASEFFPPTDRELALRGVIHTGWSTVAAKQPDDLKIPKEDIAKIQEVLQRAEALDKMEELRIGILMLKHKQMVDNCHGDGINSCRICGLLFAPQKGDQQRLAGSQLCTICLKGVCQRCKIFSKTGSGDLQILCQVCANQKELWRRSGAWLNNVMPSISLTDDELLKVQEKQMSIKRNYISTSSFGRSAGSLPREFMNPARCDSSDESDEEEIEATPTLNPQADVTPKQTPDASPLPSLKFVKELHPKKSADGARISSSLPRALPSEVASTISLSTTLPRRLPEETETSAIPRSFSAGFTSSKPPPQKESKPFNRKSSTDDEDSLTSSKISVNDKEEVGPLSRGLSRRGAISSRNKSKMEESRRKAKQMRDSRSPSSTSGNEGAMGDRSSSCKEESTASPSPVHLPHIRLRRPTDPAVTGVSKQDSSESEINIEESQKFRTGSQGFDHRPSEESIELRSSEENTPVSSPVKTTKVSSKGDSMHYSTIEFAKTSPSKSKASDDNGDLFAKVTPKKSSTTVSDIPRDTTAVHYSQVDFTKTAPKPVAKDTPSEFAKVKSKASTSTTESSQRSKMATITELSETQPPVPTHRREPQTSASRDSVVSSSSEPGFGPKIPSRSASLKRRSLPDTDTPPEPPARVVAPVPSPRDSPKQKRASLPSEQTSPPPVQHSRTKSNPLETMEADSTPPPVPRARARRSADPIQVTPPSPVAHRQDNTAPPLPLKEEPAKPSKPSFPPRQPKKESPSASRAFPPLPPKEDTVPSLPLKDSPPVKTSQSPLPPKDDTPTKSKYPPLPLKDDSPSVMPPLPPKDDSPAKPSYPPLPQKEDSSKAPTPRSRSSLPQKDKPSPSRAEMPPLPPKETAPQDPPSKASNFLSTDKSVSRGAKARSTIRNKAVMGSLLDEFRKKQAKMQPVTEEPKVVPDSSKLDEPKLEPSMLSSPDTSDADRKKSPGNSPLRRKNATRSGRHNRDSGGGLTTSGDDFPDGEDSFQFRRRSSAVRGRPKAATAPEEIKPEPEGGRSRTRSQAISMQRPVRRPVRGRPSGEAKSRGQGVQDEFGRVSARPRSQSPTPDGLCGSIEVCLCFEESSSQLRVTVVKCKGLRSMDANGLSDPYVNVFLAPGIKMHEMHTDVKFKTLNPEFHETFTFYGIEKSCFGDMKLHLVVMDYDEFSKDDFIGATAVNLYELEFAQTSSLTLRRLLDDMVPQQILKPCERYHGRIELKMTYSKENERFTVYVFGAKQLLSFGTREITCDPFMKCHVCCRGNILKQKTKICSKTVDPEFNEELHFHIKPQDLTFCRMTITLLDHKKLKDSFLGELHFNAISFWRDFMSNPNQVVHEWYELKERDFHTHKKTEVASAPYLPNRRMRSSSGSQLKNMASIAPSYVRSIKGGRVSLSSPVHVESKLKYYTLPRALFSNSDKH